MSDSELLTLEEARRILRCSKSKLYTERKAGRLKTRRFGFRLIRVHRDDLAEYIRTAPVGVAQ
jgi:excisionase family DNA binding protein